MSKRRFFPVTVLLASMLLSLLTGCGMLSTVEVYDGANFIPIRPASNVPVSVLGKEDFIADQNGMPVCKSETILAQRGVDVSEFQGDIDWEAVAASSIQFAFLRCGYRGASEGGLAEDQKFAENYEKARAAGLEVGVYFYSQALNEEEALEEADLVAKILDGRKLDLPVVFGRSMGLAGYDTGVYMNLNTGYHTWDLSKLADYAIWLSDPGPYPRFYYKADFWQYSFTGTVPGIGGNVDLNFRFLPRES